VKGRSSNKVRCETEGADPIFGNMQTLFLTGA
jgi:hypothetical protein